jgi:hypothetical protein
MKKILLGVAVFGAAFLLSGCGKQADPNQNTAQDQTQKNASAASSAITSIKDAMGLGTKMKCEYSTKMGADTVKSTVYVEGEKFKSTGTINGATQNTLFDGDAMYMWTEGKTTGFKMAMSCINDLKASSPQGQQNGPNVKSPEDQFKDATETSCSSITDSVDFTAPTSVTFTDQCEMMKNSTEMMKNVKIPAGANIPNMPSQPMQ